MADDPDDVDPFAYDFMTVHPEELLDPTPPEWLFALLGRITSAHVYVELYMAGLALSLRSGFSPTKAEAFRAMSRGGELVRLVRSTTGAGDRYDQLAHRFEDLRRRRDEHVHACLWWTDADGPFSDYWSLQHPRSGGEIILSSRGEERMRALVDELEALSTEAFQWLRERGGFVESR